MYISSAAVADSLAGTYARQKGAQGRVMWFDAEANIWALSTRAKVAATIAKCKAANINTIVVDVKPLAGVVLYRSKIAPRLTSFNGKPYPRNYDLLKTVVEEGHKAGIPVHAAINVFAEGSRTRPGGPAHKHVDWQCVQYEAERVLRVEGEKPVVLGRPNVPLSKGHVCLYGLSSETAGKLPANTVYLRVGADGMPVQTGVASGLARISAPEDGYLLLGSGKSGQWLRKVAESGKPLTLEAKDALLRVGELGDMHHAVFVNPSNPEVRSYALSIIKEICSKYNVDGIVLDRMRYPNLYTDFSDITREAFEKHIGRAVENWPRDVIVRSISSPEDPVRGPLFKDWLKFRAQVMHDFLAEARDTVKSAKPKALLGIYVGSWYPVYFDVGVNWGSPSNAADYEWWPEGYETTGYADLVDFMFTGCYYANPNRKDAVKAGDPEWMSVEAAAQESVNAVKDDTFVYASLYLLQYHNQPDRFMRAVKESLSNSQGCMFFDLVYARDYDWWDVLKEAFPNSAKAPHDVDGLLAKVRSASRRQASR